MLFVIKNDEDLATQGDTGSIARCSLSMSTPTTGGRGETYVYVYLCLPHHGERVVVVILFDQDLVLLGHVSEKRYVALQSSAT